MAQRDADDIDHQIVDFSRKCLEECDKIDLAVPVAELNGIFCEALQLSSLRSLSLRGNKDIRLDDVSVAILVNSLISCRISLISLSLKYHRIKDSGVIHICQLILPENSDMNGIQELDLEGNDIEVGGCYALQQCLVRKDCNISLLNLSWNAIGSKGGLAISDALEINNSLENLQLANCDLTLTTIISISTSIAHNRTLQCLVLDRPLLSGPQEDNVDHVTRTLSSHHSLSALSLRYCRITDFGASLLSQELPKNFSLRCLNLECNNIGSRGAEALSSYLIQVNRLEALLLSSNKIGDDGAIAISEALRVNTSLKEVILRHNNIGHNGLVAIGQCLHRNKFLEYLGIWGNLFDDISSHLFYDLIETKGVGTNADLKFDISIYVVDSVHHVAECPF